MREGLNFALGDLSFFAPEKCIVLTHFGEYYENLKISLFAYKDAM